MANDSLQISILDKSINVSSQSETSSFIDEYYNSNGNRGNIKFARLSTQQMKLLLKLGNYGVCGIEKCECRSWKNNKVSSKSLNSRSECEAALRQACSACSHDIVNHMSSDLWYSNKIEVIITSDGVFMGFEMERLPKVESINRILFGTLRKKVLSTAATHKDSLGQPPFEIPSIAVAVNNLIFYKFQYASEEEFQLMHDSAKIFLNYFDKYQFEPVANGNWSNYGVDELACKLNYCRWLMYSRPDMCNAPPYFKPSTIFGKNWLRIVFPEFRQVLVKKRNFPDKLTGEKRVLFLNSFFNFLSVLELEVYAKDSPIWYGGASSSGCSPMESTEMKEINTINAVDGTTNNLCDIDRKSVSLFESHSLAYSTIITMSFGLFCILILHLHMIVYNTCT